MRRGPQTWTQTLLLLLKIENCFYLTKEKNVYVQK